MAQRCASPPMKNLISVGGQHQGDTIMITLAHFPVSRADQIYSDVKVVFRVFCFCFFTLQPKKAKVLPSPCQAGWRREHDN